VIKYYLLIPFILFSYGCSNVPYISELKDGNALPNCPEEGVWNNCFGTQTWADGDQYVGEWKDGKKHGQGTYTYANGNKYVGEVKDDKRHGQGTETYADGVWFHD
jgi:hypothetical protein